QRALLELARDHRRADEEPREDGKHGEHADRRDEPAELAFEVRDDDVATGARPRREASGERVAAERRFDRQPRRERASGERDEEPGRCDELRPVLPPRHPYHRSGTLSGTPGVGRRSGAMYASRRSSSPTRSTRHDGSTTGPSTSARIVS